MNIYKSCPVTLILIIINVVLYAFLEFKGMQEGYYLYNAGVLTLSRFTGGGWYTIITSMFLHGSITHLGCNMISLYYLGTAIERLYGHGRFVALYFVSGICGNLASLLTMMFTTDFGVVGASGAIFGLFGAYGYLLLRERKTPVVLAMSPSAKSVQSFFIFLVINIVIGLMPGIAMEAHLGGLIAGVVLAAIMYAGMRRQALARRANLLR